jgi:hypothetical protein
MLPYNYLDNITEINRKPVICAERAGLLGEYIGVTASSIDDIHPIWTDTRFGHQDAFVGVKDSSFSVRENAQPKPGQPTFSVHPSPAIQNMTITIPQYRDLDSKTCLHVFNTAGRCIKTFSHLDHTIVWNCLDNKGNRIPGGVYLFYLESSKGASIRVNIKL